MEEVKQRMRLSDRQRNAVIHTDDNGVADPAPLFVMDFATWQQLYPYNFFNYFAPEGSVASYARYKPAWQRYELLYPLEVKILRGIYDSLDRDADRILGNSMLSKRYYQAYVILCTLVDELDALVDRELTTQGRWNHGYVINDTIVGD